jgi:hypothetical protein
MRSTNPTPPSNHHKVCLLSRDIENMYSLSGLMLALVIFASVELLGAM